eukprot:m.591478 g.591478  ORF g.591478 m.591478 type:complete len:809 (+) comp22379_c1_seq5:540-2966(+)
MEFDYQVPTGEEAVVVARAATALIAVSNGSWNKAPCEQHTENSQTHSVANTLHKVHSTDRQPNRYLQSWTTSPTTHKHNGYVMAAPSAVGSPMDGSARTASAQARESAKTPPRKSKRKDTMDSRHNAMYTPSQEFVHDDRLGFQFEHSPLHTPRKKHLSKRPRLLPAPYSGVRRELSGDLHHRDVEVRPGVEDGQNLKVSFGMFRQMDTRIPNIAEGMPPPPTTIVQSMGDVPQQLSGVIPIAMQPAYVTGRPLLLQPQPCVGSRTFSGMSSPHVSSTEPPSGQAPVQYSFNRATALSAMQRTSISQKSPAQRHSGKSRKVSASTVLPQSSRKSFKAVSGRQQAGATVVTKKNGKMHPTPGAEAFSLELSDCEEMHVSTFVTTSSSVERALKFQVQTDPILQRGIAQDNLRAPMSPPCTLSELLQLNDVEQWPLVRIGDCFRIRFKSRWGKYCGDRTRAATNTAGIAPKAFSSSTSSIRVRAPHGQVGMEFTILPKNNGTSLMSPTPTPPSTPTKMNTLREALLMQSEERTSGNSEKHGQSVASGIPNGPTCSPPRNYKDPTKRCSPSPRNGQSPTSSKPRNRCLVSVETLYWDVCARYILCLRCGKRPRDVTLATREVFPHGGLATAAKTPLAPSGIKSKEDRMNGTASSTCAGSARDADCVGDSCKCTYGNDLLQAAPMRSTKGRSFVQTTLDDYTDIYVKVPRHRAHGLDNDWMKNLPRPRFSKDEVKAAVSGSQGTSSGLRTPKPMLIRITEKVYDASGRLAAKTVFGGFVRLTAKNGCVKLKEDQKGRYLSTVQTGSATAPST